jgi:hypothetical protein
MSIGNVSLLADLTIAVWTGRKTDLTASAQVTQDNSADSKAARVSKDLLAGSELNKKIISYAQETRMFHYERTLPWADRGSRLIPLTLFHDYKDTMETRKLAFEKMVNEFTETYDAMVEKAKTNLGSLFNAGDYPNAQAVGNKFRFDLVFSPVPESGDFRIDIASAELDMLREQYEASYEGRLADATKDIWTRLRDQLQNLSERLANKEEGQKTIYKAALLGNARELCTLMKDLNITNDPKLEEARRATELAVFGVDIDDIRESQYCREDTKSKIDTILKNYEW